jgi:hypothetical protein
MSVLEEQAAYTSIVEKDMNGSECLDSSFYNLVSIDNGIVICNSFSASFLDL